MDSQDDPIRLAAAYQPECILIEKLYDWVYKPFSTSAVYKTVLDIATPSGADLNFYNVVNNVSYYLTIVPDPITPVTVTLGTPQFNVPVTVGGNPATVTCLPITKIVKFTIVAHPTSGATPQATAPRTMALTEKVALCLPQEIYNAEVQDDYSGKYIDIATPRILLTAVDNGTLGTVSGSTVPFVVNVNFLLCQDIKIRYPVVFRVDGTLCSPRPDDITCPVDPGCPALTFPAQCPNVFPRTSA